MKTPASFLYLPALFAAVAISLSCSAGAATLYQDNFDSGTSAASWKVNNNNNGTNAANFNFDYSTLGIPVAPKTVGGTTIGVKLSANISGTGPTSGVLPSISVSPTGQAFTGDYKVTFDWWQNWLGSTTTGIANASGGSGSTQLSTFGILTAGTTPSYVTSTDGVFFAATGDGASALDYRAYSVAKPAGYVVADSPINVYAAGSQANTASLYTTLWPAGASAGPIQQGISTTQNGLSLAGTSGFRWNEVEIMKLGAIVTWTVNGTLLDTLDTTSFSGTLGGNNILFGMADTTLTAGTPAALFSQLDFTLIDNVSVVEVPEPTTMIFGMLGLFGLGFRRRRA